MRETLYQFRIADERPAKGDQVGMAALNCSSSRFLGVTAIRHQRAGKYPAEFFRSHGRPEFMKAKRQTINNVEVSEFVAVQALGHIKENLAKIG